VNIGTRSEPGRPTAAGLSPQALVRRCTWAARGRWILRPSYLRYAHRRHPPETIEPSTEVVIEGFPRSANTFSVFAFQLAQEGPVRVAHHLHAPIQVAAGIRMQIPVIVLVRAPADAVLSLVLRNPYISIRRALSDYATFYERVLSIRGGYVVAPFEEVTSDFGAVIRRVNERYRSEFRPFDRTPANVAECYALIEEKSQGLPWADDINLYASGLLTRRALEEIRRAGRSSITQTRGVSESRVARPSDLRNRMKAGLEAAYVDPSLAAARERAEAAYAAFVDDGGVSGVASPRAAAGT
jgi:hypothetical protein